MALSGVAQPSHKASPTEQALSSTLQNTSAQDSHIGVWCFLLLPHRHRACSGSWLSSKVCSGRGSNPGFLPVVSTRVQSKFCQQLGNLPLKNKPIRAPGRHRR